MQSPTFASPFFGDQFMARFQHGVPQIDLWKPAMSGIDPPREPERPRHPRPMRALPAEPSEWRILWESLTDVERALHGEVTSEDVRVEANIREAFHMSDGDNPIGDRLCAEYVGGLIDAGDLPGWWIDGGYTAEILASLSVKMWAAAETYDVARGDHTKAIRAVQMEPDADPEWRAYDEAKAAYPALYADYLERVRLRAVERTGYATEAEAAAEWASRANAGLP